MPIEGERRVGYSLTLCCLWSVAIIFRLYVRYYVRRGAKRSTYYLSDGFLLAAWVFATAFVGVEVWLVKGALNARLLNPSAEEKRRNAIAYLKGTFFLYVGYITGVWLLKAAFLANYFSAKESMSPRLYKSLLGATGFAAVTYVMVMFIQLFACWPTSRFWAVGKESCLVTHPLIHSLSISIAHFVTDITTMVVGWFVIRAALKHRGWREWTSIMIIYWLATLSMIFAVVRLAIGMDMTMKTQKGTLFSSKEGANVRAWTAIATIAEFFIAFLAAGLPSLRIYAKWLQNTAQDEMPTRSRNKMGVSISQMMISSHATTTGGRDSMETEGNLRQTYSTPGQDIELKNGDELKPNRFGEK